MQELDSRTETQRGAFDAVIAAIHHRWIVLDQTQFDASSPGRESDIGHIGGIPVTSVDEDYAGLLHRVSDPWATQGLTMGQPIRASVDLGRRARLSRLHSLQHLVFLGYQVRHGRVERSGGYVDSCSATVTLPQRRSHFEVEVDDIYCWVERVIDDDLLINSVVRSLDRGTRFWHIDGVGTVACEARHPARTSEIGAFRLHAEAVDKSAIHLTATLLDV